MELIYIIGTSLIAAIVIWYIFFGTRQEKERLDELDDNNKRWLLVGIGLHTVISPALRKYISPRLDHLWQTLKNKSNIDTQLYPHQLKRYQSTYLNYEAINYNKKLWQKEKSCYDYTVKNSVVLSKLFLETHMAHYAAFDDSCDLSALLGIIIKTGISPQNAIPIAEKVRSEVRNSWAYCSFAEWGCTQYTEFLDLIFQLVKCLGLSTQEEMDVISELDKWKQNGQKFLAETKSVNFTEITTQIQTMIENAEKIAFDTPETIKQIKEELTAQQKILNHLKRKHELEKDMPSHLPEFRTKIGLSCPMNIGKYEFSFDVIVDKRLECRRTKIVGLSYPMEICKHDFHVDVIVDERLEYRMTNKVVRPLHEGFTINFKCEVPENGDSYRSLYALQYLIGIPGDLNSKELHQRVLTTILDYVKANHDSELRYDIHCRYLLTLINSCKDYVISHLNECLLKAISNGKCQIAKAIAWKLTRMFVGMNQGLQFINIWPGIVCHCRGNKEWIYPDDQTFCSEEVVIFVEVHSYNSIQASKEDFFGVPVQYKVMDNHSPEAKRVAQHTNLKHSTADFSMMRKISSLQAEILFVRHRNLTLISRSPIKSIAFRSEDQRLVNKPCIQLYCRVKGIIPVGEPHFSKMINGHPIDVIEGFSQLLVRTLSIGDEVGFINGGCGTLGGFLLYRGEKAFLTCAHVLFSCENLAPDADRSFIDENKIFVKCKDKSNGQVFPCGTYLDHRFPPYRSEDGVSIDAAIVKLHDDCSIQNGGLNNIYLNYSVINYEEIGINTNISTESVGAVSFSQEKVAKIKIIHANPTEFETLHNLIGRTWQETASTAMTDEIHLQIAIDKAGEKERKAPRIVQLYKQIAFENIDFQQGDSGMCIYAIDDDRKKGCIGMAVASHPGGGCIVTPMKSILSSLNIAWKRP